MLGLRRCGLRRCRSGRTVAHVAELARTAVATAAARAEAARVVEATAAVMAVAVAGTVEACSKSTNRICAGL